MILIFATLYPLIIRNEEIFLLKKFGKVFEEYYARTPRFFPNFKLFQEPDRYVMNPRLFRRTVGDVLWFIWLAAIVVLIQVLQEYGIISPFLHIP